MRACPMFNVESDCYWDKRVFCDTLLSVLPAFCQLALSLCRSIHMALGKRSHSGCCVVLPQYWCPLWMSWGDLGRRLSTVSWLFWFAYDVPADVERRGARRLWVRCESMLGVSAIHWKRWVWQPSDGFSSQELSELVVRLFRLSVCWYGSNWGLSPPNVVSSHLIVFHWPICHSHLRQSNLPSSNIVKKKKVPKRKKTV